MDDEEKDNHKSSSAPGLAPGPGLAPADKNVVVPDKSVSLINEGTDIPIKWPTFGAATQIELSTNRYVEVGSRVTHPHTPSHTCQHTLRIFTHTNTL